MKIYITLIGKLKDDDINKHKHKKVIHINAAINEYIVNNIITDAVVLETLIELGFKPNN